MTTSIIYTAIEEIKITQEEYENAVAAYDDRLVDDDCSDLLEIIEIYENDEIISKSKDCVITIDIDYDFVYNTIFTYWMNEVKKHQGYAFLNMCEKDGFICKDKTTFGEFSSFISSYKSDPRIRYLIKKYFIQIKIKKYIKTCNLYKKLKNFKKVCNFTYRNYTNIINGKMIYNYDRPLNCNYEKLALIRDIPINESIFYNNFEKTNFSFPLKSSLPEYDIFKSPNS